MLGKFAPTEDEQGTPNYCCVSIPVLRRDVCCGVPVVAENEFARFCNWCHLAWYSLTWETWSLSTLCFDRKRPRYDAFVSVYFIFSSATDYNFGWKPSKNRYAVDLSDRQKNIRPHVVDLKEMYEDTSLAAVRVSIPVCFHVGYMDHGQIPVIRSTRMMYDYRLRR